VNSTLERGFLYVAGTPMSIFGSLGIVKAGFVTLWASVEIWCFHGPRHLRNAGFQPNDVPELLTYAFDSDDSFYVAEDRLRVVLGRDCGVGVGVNTNSAPWLWWNIRMVSLTFCLSAFGLLPFVHIITRDVSDRSFRSTWMYPILRVVGSALTGTMVQLILQLRILAILHCRLRFMSINDHLRNDVGRIPPECWHPDLRSEDCLSSVKIGKRPSFYSRLCAYVFQMEILSAP
jgi:hypothetical protein